MNVHNEQALPEMPLAGPEFEPGNFMPESPSALRAYMGLALGIATVAVSAGLHITRKEAREAELKALRDRDAATSNDEWWDHDQNSQRWSRIRGNIEDGTPQDPEDMEGVE